MYEGKTFELGLDDGSSAKMMVFDDGPPELGFSSSSAFVGAEIGVFIEWLVRVAEEVGEYEV